MSNAHGDGDGPIPPGAQPGGGAYNDELLMLTERIPADAVLLLVLGGERGSGFSIAVRTGHLGPKDIAAVLRETADSIEKAAV